MSKSSGSGRQRFDIDIEAAIARGMPEQNSRSTPLFSTVAVAAAVRAEQLGIGPYPLAFLAACVRALGLDGALRLPEPLIGEHRIALVRGWMSAPTPRSSPDVLLDDVFARWLNTVAMILTARRTLTRRGPQ